MTAEYSSSNSGGALRVPYANSGLGHGSAVGFDWVTGALKATEGFNIVVRTCPLVNVFELNKPRLLPNSGLSTMRISARSETGQPIIVEF